MQCSINSFSWKSIFVQIKIFLRFSFSFQFMDTVKTYSTSPIHYFKGKYIIRSEIFGYFKLSKIRSIHSTPWTLWSTYPFIKRWIYDRWEGLKNWYFILLYLSESLSVDLFSIVKVSISSDKDPKLYAFTGSGVCTCRSIYHICISQMD